ncbi:MAG: MurR/RpiR family transcriptional regulator [Anaerovoracaceae bacterium]|jgi:DNA-binding MurR/RpiR family transcriptional regulator
MKSVSWQDRIRGAYAQLRPSEQKVAAFFLEHPGQISEMNIAAVAEAAGVSEPTVLRCVKALGCKGFKDFKRHLAAGSAAQPDSFDLMGGIHLSPWDRIEDLPLRTISTQREALDALLRSLDPALLKKAAGMLADAQNINIFSVENSETAAADLQVKLNFLGLCCSHFTDPYLQQISAGHMRQGDTAVAFSRSGRSIDTVKALKTARRAGAATIAVTGFDEAVLSKYADLTLLTGAPAQTVYGNAIFSRVTDIAVVDMLYMAIILSDYDRFSANLDKSGRVIADRGYPPER